MLVGRRRIVVGRGRGRRRRRRRREEWRQRQDPGEIAGGRGAGWQRAELVRGCEQEGGAEAVVGVDCRRG